MCMICNDNNSMTMEQSVANLFEMKQSLGVEHATKVALMIANNWDKSGYEDFSQKCAGMIINMTDLFVRASNKNFEQTDGRPQS